jgi:hypothetical protein
MAARQKLGASPWRQPLRPPTEAAYRCGIPMSRPILAASLHRARPNCPRRQDRSWWRLERRAGGRCPAALRPCTH